MAAEHGPLVCEALARSHDSVRVVARRVRTRDAPGRRLASAARYLVAAAAVHLVDSPPLVLAVVHAAGVSTRRRHASRRGRSRAAAPSRPRDVGADDPMFVRHRATGAGAGSSVGVVVVLPVVPPARLGLGLALA